MTSMTQFARVSDQQVETLKAMIDRAEPRPLNSLDRCDRCSARAQSVFHLEAQTAPLMFCGRHTRLHLDALLDCNPVSFWIDPTELFSVTALKVPAPSRVKDGDGLTGA